MKLCIILFPIFFLSCGVDPQANKNIPVAYSASLEAENTDVEKEKTQFLIPEKVNQNIIDNIEFDFNPFKLNNAEYALNPFLKNNNLDTVYLLSYECFQEYGSIQYEEPKVKIFSPTNCYKPNLTVFKIAPDSVHSFPANLILKDTLKNLKLGFDFFAVNKDFKLNIGDRINIFDRPESEKAIIWAKEKALP